MFNAPSCTYQGKCACSCFLLASCCSPVNCTTNALHGFWSLVHGFFVKSSQKPQNMLKNCQNTLKYAQNPLFFTFFHQFLPNFTKIKKIQRRYDPFCSGIVWSRPRAITYISSSGIRSLCSLNPSDEIVYDV